MTKRLLLIGGVFIICLIAIGLITTSHHNVKKTQLSPTKLYVALGDSVAAGDGLENYSDSSACDRTTEAYPNLVATQLNLVVKNVACSGATLPVGILGQQQVNQLMIAPQLNQLFSQPKPYLISITIGANDAQWTSFISKCYTGQCGSPDDTAAISGLLTGVSTNLKNTLSQIQNYYKTAMPHVVVTGYYQVFPAGDATCSDLTGIDASELTWGRQMQTNLNNTISAIVSQYAFSKYAAIDFSGHELCTADSWVQGVSDTAPYHPTDAGQAEYAKQVIAANKLFK